MQESPLNLLLIEDEDDHFALIKRLLRKASNESVTIHRVDRLDSGIACLENGREFDAVLTDLNLPDSNGLDTFRAVRQQANGTPLIALTSQAVTEDGIALMREGADDFLPKTNLDGALLFRSVLCAVERRRLNEAEVELHQRAGKMDIARRIQSSILPNPLPVWDDFEITAVSIPADEVGGDYFDFMTLENGDYLIAIGDATGHGPGAALVMAMAAASLRTLSRIYTDLGEVLTRLNHLLVKETPEFMFMTFCLLRVDRGGKLFWANAGHLPPQLFSGDSSEPVFLCSSEDHMPLGLMEGVQFVESSCPLRQGDLVCAVTDGITESMSPEMGLFGDDRLDRILFRNRDNSTEQIVDTLRAAVLGWRQDCPSNDDETILAMRWKTDG